MILHAKFKKGSDCHIHVDAYKISLIEDSLKIQIIH